MLRNALKGGIIWSEFPIGICHLLPVSIPPSLKLISKPKRRAPCRTFGPVQNIHKTFDLYQKVLDILSCPKPSGIDQICSHIFNRTKCQGPFWSGPNVLCTKCLMDILDRTKCLLMERFAPLYPKLKIATFLPALACFTGEEFREGKDAELSLNMIETFHWIHLMSENTTTVSPCVFIDRKILHQTTMSLSVCLIKEL